MAFPLPETEPDPDELCPGSGQAPRGTRGIGVRHVYGGGCAVCPQQVTVTDSWVIRDHYPPGAIHGHLLTRYKDS